MPWEGLILILENRVEYCRVQGEAAVEKEFQNVEINSRWDIDFSALSLVRPRGQVQKSRRLKADI